MTFEKKVIFILQIKGKEVTIYGSLPVAGKIVSKNYVTIYGSLPLVGIILHCMFILYKKKNTYKHIYI